ncbi:MAG: hypothetical protein ACFB8W_04265, partial [Elainellaceae cyanobacterium]
MSATPSSPDRPSPDVTNADVVSVDAVVMSTGVTITAEGSSATAPTGQPTEVSTVTVQAATVQASIVQTATDGFATDSQAITLSGTGSALATTQGSFGSFLAPLTTETFKQVVDDVQEKLEIVNQTLSMLDSLLDSQGFDAILNEMLRSITLKTGELLNADRTTIYLLDEEKNELWSILAKNEKGGNLELRFPATMGIAG